MFDSATQSGAIVVNLLLTTWVIAVLVDGYVRTQASIRRAKGWRTLAPHIVPLPNARASAALAQLQSCAERSNVATDRVAQLAKSETSGGLPPSRTFVSPFYRYLIWPCGWVASDQSRPHSFVLSFAFLPVFRHTPLLLAGPILFRCKLVASLWRAYPAGACFAAVGAHEGERRSTSSASRCNSEPRV